MHYLKKALGRNCSSWSLDYHHKPAFSFSTKLSPLRSWSLSLDTALEDYVATANFGVMNPFPPFRQIMDTSSPAVFVNAELLNMYLGRRVRAVVQVLGIEGGVILGQSTDRQQFTVKGSQSFPVSHYVEVIGIADGNQSIRAEICTDFGEKFEAASYNTLCQLANGKHKNLFL